MARRRKLEELEATRRARVQLEVARDREVLVATKQREEVAQQGWCGGAGIVVG